MGPEGESLGKMSSRAANELAARMNLDLYCVAPNANPPVCKILNYGKFRYEQQKAKKESKKNQHVVETKQIQLHLNIGQHDLLTKAKAARKFLEEGNRVELCVVFKGREMTHPEIGEALRVKFVEEVADVAEIVKTPFWEGKWYKSILGPKKNK
ncbi:MAG: translation initiation factor IF-3 [Bacilli bacterium]|nr:translation initiation factor IF-3 [Bacilli bacterium]